MTIGIVTALSVVLARAQFIDSSELGYKKNGVTTTATANIPPITRIQSDIIRCFLSIILPHPLNPLLLQRRGGRIEKRGVAPLRRPDKIPLNLPLLKGETNMPLWKRGKKGDFVYSQRI